jgi:hypothetical protein
MIFMEREIIVIGYIDPGSGLMLLQIIASALCGVALALKRVRTKIAAVILRRKK